MSPTLPPRPPQRARLDYRAGKRLAAADYQRAQDYTLSGQQIRCRSLHTWGVASGLDISVAANGGPEVRISPGMAVDADGRQIVLTQARTINLSRELSPELYLSIAYDSAFQDRRIFTRGSGYVRLVDEPRIVASANPPPADGSWIVLVLLTFTPERRLQSPDLSVRRYCGLEVGAMGFPQPATDPAACPNLGIVDQQGALNVVSPLTDIFGSVTVHGRVSVGLPGDQSTAALAVQAEAPRPGAGFVTSEGVFVYGTPDALVGVQTGDSLHVAGDAEAQAPLQVAKVVASQTVTVDKTPATPFTNAPYSIGRGLALRILTSELGIGLAVGAQGGVGVGGAPGERLLTVTAGDIELDQGHAVRFLADGTLVAGAPANAMAFQTATTPSSLEARDAGDILFFVGQEALQAAPAMIVTRGGKVGVGVVDPPSTLTVNGLIRTSEGLVFPDGSIQTEAVSPIPIGTVVDWWRDSSATSWSGDGFQLCDGSTIIDPASPLVGQPTPDLRSTFVAGVVSYEQIGAKGGAETHTHTFSISSHTHSIAHVHAIKGSTGGPEQSAGDRIAGSSISNSEHTHTIDTMSGGASPSVTGQNTPVPEGTTQPASNLPPFMQLLKVMRIK